MFKNQASVVIKDRGRAPQRRATGPGVLLETSENQERSC